MMKYYNKNKTLKTTVVNARKRINNVENVNENYFGNCFLTTYCIGNKDDSIEELGTKIRNSIDVVT